MLWEDNIKIYYKEIGCEGLGWIHLSQVLDTWCVPLNTLIKFDFHKVLKILDNMRKSWLIKKGSALWN